MFRIRALGALVTCLGLVACGGSGAPAASNIASAPASVAAKSASVLASSAPATTAASSGGTSASGQAAVAQSPPPLSPAVKVKVGVIGLAPEAGIYIAQERGYFKAEGLDTEITPFRSTSDQIALLATNKLHYGTAGPDPALFNANQRDVGLKIVAANASVTKNDGSAAFLVRQDLIDSGKYKSLADLKGMTIGLNNSGTTSQLYVERILAMGGLTKADVKFTTVAFPDMLTALGNKAIDAGWEVEPFVSGAAAKGLAKGVVPVSQAYPGAVTELIMMSPGFAKDEPEAAKRFMVGFLRGQRDYYSAFVGNLNPAGRDDIITILTKYTAIKDPKAFTNLGMSGADPNGELDDKVLSDMQDYFLASGTQKEKIELSRVVDHSYAQYAVQRLGRM